jgi:hypothetical protein
VTHSSTIKQQQKISIGQKYSKEGITYLLQSPTGNGIRIGLDKRF